MSEHILVDHSDRVTTVTISRPEKKNAINQAMYGAMADAIMEYGASDASRALVITGEGEMFTAGNDLSDFQTREEGGEVRPVERFLHAILECPKPLIAAVNGPAIGIGLTMLLHCDLVFAAETAYISAPFASLGVVPEAGSSMLLPDLVGMAVANDVFLTGRRLTAPEALGFGLVSRVYPDAELMGETRQVALQVAHSAPNAMKRSKALIRHNHHEIGACMTRELEVFSDQLKSPEFAEVITAKMEKRAPKFD